MSLKTRLISYAAIAAVFVSTSAAALAEATVWRIDPVHSGVTFKVRHLVTKVPGDFTEFSGEIHFDADNPTKAKAVGTIQAASVDTNNEKRDGHLRGDDFFSVSENPLITFTSTKWEPVGGNKFKVTGDLTMNGQTHPVELDVEYLGQGEFRGGTRAGFEASGTIDRTDWDINYGTPLVGEEVEIYITIEAEKA